MIKRKDARCHSAVRLQSPRTRKQALGGSHAPELSSATMAVQETAVKSKSSKYLADNAGTDGQNFGGSGSLSESCGNFRPRMSRSQRAGRDFLPADCGAAPGTTAFPDVIHSLLICLLAAMAKVVLTKLGIGCTGKLKNKVRVAKR